MKRIGTLAFTSAILFGCTTTAEPDNTIPWEEVQPLLETCKVDTIYQGHDRRVMLTLDDGSQLHTRSPGLDDILYLIADLKGCDREIGQILE